MPELFIFKMCDSFFPNSTSLGLKQSELVNIYCYVPIVIGMPNHIHVLWEQLKMNGKESPKATASVRVIMSNDFPLEQGGWFGIFHFSVNAYTANVASQCSPP